jgi:DNA replication protein DnaC
MDILDKKAYLDDMERFRASLETIKAPARFKIDLPTERVFNYLNEIYKTKVEGREMKYQPEESRLMLEKVAKWITGNYKPGLLLYGTVGSGKTTIADSLLKLIIILRPAELPRRLSALELTNIAKDDYEGFKEVSRAKLLFIDDLGEEPISVKTFGNEITPMVELLYWRYEKRLFTVITTNLKETEIKSVYGARIEDRIAETFDRLYFNNPSYRKKIASI